jgi:hypothetical protein
MDDPGANIHSFVIKIWLEETMGESGRVVWRGRITHVSSGERRLIKHLNEIHSFVWPYLETVGVKPNIGRRVGRWLQRWYSRLKIDHGK